MGYMCYIKGIYLSIKKKKKKTGVSLVFIVTRVVKKKINTHGSGACQNDGSSVLHCYTAESAN